jgi:hypothetical protein
MIADARADERRYPVSGSRNSSDRLSLQKPFQSSARGIVTYFPPPDVPRGKPRGPPALHRETK